MAWKRIDFRREWLLVTGMLLLTSAGCTSFKTAVDPNQTAAPTKEEPASLDWLTLQADLMRYADRYAMIMSQALDDFRRHPMPADARWAIQSDLTYGTASLFSLAAEPNPEAGLLDMVVIVTLGRMVYEDYHTQWGEPVAPVLEGFRLAEEELWIVARQVLSTQEEAEFRDLILAWRNAHPHQNQFVYLRFGDFAKGRQDSPLVKKARSRGLFGTVRDVTEQVEQSRLLAERSIYLGSRLPLLTGDFVTLWLSTWINNPQVTELRLDVNTITEVLQRLVVLGENLPDEVMDRVSEERKQIVGDLVAQEKQLGGLLTQVEQVVEDVNTLVVNADHLMTHFDPVLALGIPAALDANRIQAMMEQTSELILQFTALVDNVDQLVASPESDKHMATVVGLVDHFETLTTRSMNYAFLLGVGFLVVVLLVLTAYRSLSQKIAALGTKRGNKP